MLGLQQRRQHLPQHLSTSLQTFTLDTLQQQLSAQQHYADQQKLLNDYLESQQTSFNPAVVIDNNSNPFMTYDYSNPQIRIQQSTPTPQLSTGFSPSPMLSTHTASTGLDSWNSYNSNVQGSQSLQTPQHSRTTSSHQRASSSSSIGSTGSQYQPAAQSAGYQYVAFARSVSPSRVAPMVDSSTFADPSSRSFSNNNVNNNSNHLPTPTHTPTQDSFMNQNNFSTYTPHTSSDIGSTMAAHMSMKQALQDQHVPDEEVPGFAHSARHSVSSYGRDSPATPHTAQGEDMDFKMPPNGKTLRKVDSWLFDQLLTYDDAIDMRPVPKFERTYTDVAADYSFDSNSVVAPTQSIPQQPTANTLLSPYRTGNSNDIIQRSLKAAQKLRSQSPSSTASRGDSPFRRGSPYQQSNHSFQSPRMGVNTAAAAREIKHEADAAHAMKLQVSQTEEKTISPKDALLDYREADDDSKVPLFPDGGASEYDHQYNGADQYRNATQSTFDTTSSFRRDSSSWATPQFSPNFSTPVTGTPQAPSTFAFAPPSVQGNIHNLPYNSASQYRQVPQMSSAPEQNPEFPAHLTSMESSCSELEPSSQSSDRLQKPADTKADSGTYTCTYHGCSQRFETPQKLQKHKREGHRNAAPTSVGVGAGTSPSMTSAALLERNSQAGPHKCERINPTTNKPCNTIFSRPYDLTRHEDTIHNVRKQKVRCALCVEEKTFSRNDALTRHMVRIHHRSAQHKHS
jgi:hypothetical protein